MVLVACQVGIDLAGKAMSVGSSVSVTASSTASPQLTTSPLVLEYPAPDSSGGFNVTIDESVMGTIDVNGDIHLRLLPGTYTPVDDPRAHH